MTASELTSPETDFTYYWLIGLGWGICAGGGVGALVLAGLSLTLAQGFGSHVLSLIGALIMGFFFGMIGAVIIAIVPIAPLAALLAWPLYRFGVVKAWPYAIAGAMATASVPAFMFVPDFMRAGPSALEALVETCAAFALFVLPGAIGGLKGARALQRDLAKAHQLKVF